MEKRFGLVLPATPFLNAKADKIPLGVCYVHAILEKFGFRIELIDLTDAKKWEEIIPILEKTAYKNNLVGFSGTSAHRFFVIKAAKIIKDANPSCKTILGGSIAMCEADFMSAHFDLVVAGCIENIRKEDLLIRKGVFIPPPLPENLDKIPKPHREIIDYRGNGKMPILTSRFCPFKCSFCFNSLRPIKEALKRHSVCRVIEEIEDCVSDGKNHISFQDDTFIISQSWIMSLLKNIQIRNLQVKFDCRARVDFVNRKILAGLQSAGCYSISYGIESGSMKMLKRMNKNTTQEMNADILKLTKEIGIKTKAYILLGVPGEDHVTIGETMRWLEKNACNIDRLYLYMWIPYPGSKLYLEKDRSFTILTRNPNQYDELMGDSIYRSANENMATISTPFLSAEELERYFCSIRDTYSELTKF